MELPSRFCERMQQLLGDGYTAFLEGYKTPLRRGLRVNTLLCSVEQLKDLFPLPLAPSPFAEEAFYLDAPHKAGADPLHHAGAYYMQEPSAASAVTVLRVQPQEYILDLCAAPGGKSTQIAAALRGTGLLWCNEYVRSRAQILLQNIERLGVRNAVISNSDTAPLCKQLEGCFDAVLADVPCSGEGMFRKEDIALTQWSEQLVEECAARAQEILHNASLAVRAGGRIVFSTCTFAPEENEIQIARFLQLHPDFELLPCDVPFGREAFGAQALQPFATDIPEELPLHYCRRIFPSDGGEGHFIALLKKRGNEERRPIPTAKPSKASAAELVSALWEDCFTEAPRGEWIFTGDTVRLSPLIPSLKGVAILSAGVPVGTVAKNRIEPHHALFASCDPASCKRVVNLSLEDPRTEAFLHGEEIPVTCAKGFTAVTIESVPCGFGKVSGNTLKNRYPKGLRRL